MTEQKPVSRACARCAFSVEQQMPPPNLSKALICYRLPPSPIIVPGPQGMQITAIQPVVTPVSWCHEFQEKDDAPKIAL